MEVQAKIEINESFIENFADALSDDELLDFITGVDEIVSDTDFTEGLIKDLTMALFKDFEEGEKTKFLKELRELM